MYMRNELARLLEVKVPIYKCDSDEFIEFVTVEEIAEGSGLFIDINNEETICLYDLQDPSYEFELGKNVQECLFELNDFEEYFNNLDDNWYSYFLYELTHEKIF